MGRTVLLLHELPDGSHHFDWLLQPDDANLGLLTFRVSERIDLDHCSVCTAERLPDHRPLYLDYQGPVHSPGRTSQPPHTLPLHATDTPMGERGRVTRLASGECRILHQTLDSMLVECRYADQTAVCWRGLRDSAALTPAEMWIFHRAIPDISVGI